MQKLRKTLGSSTTVLETKQSTEAPKQSPKQTLTPSLKLFTKSDLKKITVPEFQRWIVPNNKKELKNSISDVGMLRCMVITYVKDIDVTFIIDGNHIKEIILEDDLIRNDDIFQCIYTEVETYADAAMQFRMLNTKGKHLDWVDITNLYRHVYGDTSIYNQIWSLFLGSPAEPIKVKSYIGFTLPTIIEMLGCNKNKYRSGMTELPKNYLQRKNLLTYLLFNAIDMWDIKFKYGKKPTGAAMIGFVNMWIDNNLHNRFPEAGFLTMINNIYDDHQIGLKNGTTVINRDNSGKLLKEYLNRNFQDLNLK